MDTKRPPLKAVTKFKIGDRVCRRADIYNPKSPYNFGTVYAVYSKPRENVGDLILGPYPELYKVRWDNGVEEQGFLPHGLEPADKTQYIIVAEWDVNGPVEVIGDILGRPYNTKEEAQAVAEKMASDNKELNWIYVTPITHTRRT